MSSTMMDVPLTLDWIADRAERWNGNVEVVSRRPDKSLSRTTYAQVITSARRLARGLQKAGIKKGDRVATLMWNHAEHLEVYFGIPLSGAAIHTLNLRLHPDEIAFIANDAKDRFVIVDDVLLPLLDKVIAAGGTFERVFVVGNHGDRESYAQFLEQAPAQGALPPLAETDELGVCYTSGTTGRPKGVVYSHRSTILHSLVAAMPDSLDLSRRDTLLPVVPMFHVNAWGLPYVAATTGTKLVCPGPHLDPASLLDLMERENVTVAAGVPTIWIGIRDVLDANPGKYKLQPNVRMIVGGSAAPEQLIRDFDRHGLTLIHAWGMTETSPIGTVSRLLPEHDAADEATRLALRARQGRPVPLVDIRVRNEQGDIPADDTTSGEVLIRGPWIAGAYAGGHTPERWTADGYFRTGDVARVDQYGFIKLTDRIADLIKSGGEWIASQELENALMGHPAVREAAVIGVAHPKWSERPLAAVVLKEGQSATADDLRAFLAPRFPKFWLPDAFVFVDTIPRTSAGKFKKTELRDKYREWQW
ncbi:MAG TPA: long-chain fatty acid--CoA ligase [Kofleriaceae bacterium]|nr:long-chain fatty acid--CoA ligase [Kofleriaceae bacterium]